MKGRVLLLAIVVIMALSVTVLGDGYDTMPADALIVDLAGWGLQPGTPGGTIHFGGGWVSTWNPVNATSTNAILVINQMLRGLVDLDPVSGVVVPELAKDWDISGGGTIITFHLREGIKWSDGELFTADDVVFTFNEVYCNDDIECVGDIRDPLRLPDGSYPDFERTGTYTVQVTFSEAVRNAMLDSFVTARILPEHVLGQYVQAGTFNDAWDRDTDPSELASMGPYLPYGWDDSEVKMRRNPYYYHYDLNDVQLPYFDKCKIYNMSKGEEVDELLDGWIDAASISLSDVGRCEASGDVGVIFGGPTYGNGAFASLNLDIDNDNLRTLFRKADFRKAIAHAMNKVRMIDEVYDGYAYPQWSPVSIPSPFYAGRDTYGGAITETSAVTYDYNLVTAAGLLDACGIIDIDADGIREFADGADVEFEFITNLGNDQRIALCEILEEDLEAIGLKVNFNPINWGDLIDEMHNGTYEMLMVGLTGGNDPNSGSNVYRSTGDLHFWHYSAATGDIFTYETTIDTYYDDGLCAVDNDAAFDIYRNFQVLQATEDLGLIYTVQPDFLLGIRDDIGNKGIINERNSSLMGTSALPMSELLYREPVFVDDDWTGSTDCGGHTWGVDAFATIQEGVDAVLLRGAVEVYAGTYDEDVTVNKHMVFRGIGDPVMTSLTLIEEAIIYESSGITADTVNLCGDLVWIEDGVRLVSPGGTVVVHSRGRWGYYDGGIYIDKDLTLLGVDDDDGWPAAIEGPRNWDEPGNALGIAIEAGHTVTIEGFEIRDASNGIAVVGASGTPTNIQLHFNYFHDNEPFAVYNFTADGGDWTDGVDVFDATGNFWNHWTGPYHDTLNEPGHGDRVGDAIDFDPWYMDEGLTTLSNVRIDPVYVDVEHGDDGNDGETPGTAKRTLQLGIAIAAEGGTVHVAAGDYDGNITINRPVTVQGEPGAYPTIWGPSPQNWDDPGSQAGIFIDAPGSVYIEGLTLRSGTNGVIVRGWDGATDAHINDNRIYDNGMGIDNWTDDFTDAIDNWWGYSSGPYHPILNPGGEGNRIGENIEFIPFRTDPFVSTDQAVASHEFLNDGWNLASVPLNPMAPAKSLDVFGDDVGDLEHRLYRYDPGTPGYDSGGGLDVLPEYGFWLYLNDAVTIDVAGEDLTGADYETVAFADGWQQISTPFSTYWKDTMVNHFDETAWSGWKSLEYAVNSGWIDNAIHQWDAEHQWYETISYGASGSPERAAWDLLYLKPWNGYWINNLSEGDLKFKFIYATPPAPTAYSMMAEEQATLWKPLSELEGVSRPPAPPMMPQATAIAQNIAVMVAPNPVQQGTAVEFRVTGAMASFVSSVTVQVYTIGGQLIFDESTQGRSVTWNLTTLSGEPVANGLYLYVAQMEFIGGETAKFNKLLILK